MYVAYIWVHLLIFAKASVWYIVYVICCIYVILIIAFLVSFWWCQKEISMKLMKLWCIHSGGAFHGHETHRLKFCHHQKGGVCVCNLLPWIFWPNYKWQVRISVPWWKLKIRCIKSKLWVNVIWTCQKLCMWQVWSMQLKV